MSLRDALVHMYNINAIALQALHSQDGRIAHFLILPVRNIRANYLHPRVYSEGYFVI